jgi:hypothetical protein
VTPGFEANFIVTARNHGLVEMTDLTIAGAEASGGKLTPLITYFPILLPEQSVEVPFVFTYTGSGNTQQGLKSRQFDPVGCITGALPDFGAGGLLDPDFMAGMAAIFQARERCISDLNPQTALATVGILFAVLQIVNNFLAPSAGLLASIAAGAIGCIIGQLLSGLFGGGGGGPGPRSSAGFSPGGLLCFAAGTMVLMSNGQMKPIEQLSAHEVVIADYARRKQAEVRELSESISSHMREIRFADSTGLEPEKSIQATDDHMFWVDGKGWTAASDLKENDWLQHYQGGRRRVISNIALHKEVKVYSLRLIDDNAFYADGVLVHDMCGLPTFVKLGQGKEVVR